MNPARCDELDYIDFLVAAQKAFTCTEAARVQPAAAAGAAAGDAPAHDSFNRLLERLPQDTEALWEESRRLVNLREGVLILDDTTLDKPYAEKMDYVTYHWSGKHHDVVKGINLITLLWSDGRALVPTDFRLYNASVDGLTKNDHFTAMLKVAKGKGFAPSYVLFDGWYSSLENLKTIRGCGWHFLTRLKGNRLVNPDRGGNARASSVEIPPEGGVVHLKVFGMIRVFRIVSKDGDVEHWATDDLNMKEAGREVLAGDAWGIEVFHRGIKQCCGIERAQVRKGTAVFNHICMSIRAFSGWRSTG